MHARSRPLLLELQAQAHAQDTLAGASEEEANPQTPAKRARFASSYASQEHELEGGGSTVAAYRDMDEAARLPSSQTPPPLHLAGTKHAPADVDAVSDASDTSSASIDSEGRPRLKWPRPSQRVRNVGIPRSREEDDDDDDEDEDMEDRQSGSSLPATDG